MKMKDSKTSLFWRGYDLLCTVEKYIAALIFVFIVGLVFVSALTRKLGVPIQWTMDVTRLLFAWLAFLSGDIALRNGALPGVDLIVKKLPNKVQVVISYFVRVLMLALLFFFVYYGFKLARSNVKRTFQAFKLSYSWVTSSLPVCSILMILSILTNSVKELQNRKGR